MGIQPTNRVRLTEQSIASIKEATHAKFERDGAYVTVTIRNSYGKAKLEDGDGVAKYPDVATAKAAVLRHNSSMKWDKEAAKPFPSLLPPVRRI